MAKDRFLIAPFETGLQTDIRPFLLPDEAWAQLFNAYVYKGRTRKRPGSQLQNQTVAIGVQQLYSRLAINLGNTDVNGIFNVAGNPNIPGNIFKEGQIFSVGAAIITVLDLGNPAVIISTQVSAGAPATRVVLTVGAGNLIQFNFGVPFANLPVWFYPAEPVMGIYQVPESAIFNGLVTAYDTQFAYQYLQAGANAGHWAILGNNPGLFDVAQLNQPAGAAVWSGANWQFIWATNWWAMNSSITAIYATNNKVLTPAATQAQRGTAYNGIKVYNTNTSLWANLLPQINAVNNGDIISAALCIAAFKDRLFLFNVTTRTSPADGSAGVDTVFASTFYWSGSLGLGAGAGDPTAAGNWRVDNNSGAGTSDIPTRESIVSVATIKDRLIVFCEVSTWEVVFTGNPSQLFIVQRINSELGVESTFSPTLFDRAILGVGNFGILACNGANVERIDEKIVNEVFEVRNADNGLIRTHGVRDFFNECVYWTFCNTVSTDSFPNQMVLYNYRNGSFALMDDSITAFGYDNNTTDLQWQDMNVAWEDVDRPWDDPSLQSQFTPVLAGNQQGILFKFFRDMPTLAKALYITNMIFGGDIIAIAAVNHNLVVGSFIQISNAQGANLGLVNDVIFQVVAVADATDFAVAYVTQGGEVYTGGGTIQRVPRPVMVSKFFNLYQKDGFNCRIEKLQFLVDQETSAGAEISVNYACNTNADTLARYPTSQQPNSSIQLTAYPTIGYENGAETLWRTIYTSVQGSYVQFGIAYNNTQMLNPASAFSDFQLHMIMIHASPTNSRIG